MKADTNRPRRGCLPLLATLAGLVLFAVLGAGILRRGAERKTYDQLRAEERAKRLAELRSKAEEELSTLAWVDKEKGVVRLPIDRAMEVAVAKLKAKPIQPAGLIADSPTGDSGAASAQAAPAASDAASTATSGAVPSPAPGGPASPTSGAAPAVPASAPLAPGAAQ